MERSQPLIGSISHTPQPAVDIFHGTKVGVVLVGPRPSSLAEGFKEPFFPPSISFHPSIYGPRVDGTCGAESHAYFSPVASGGRRGPLEETGAMARGCFRPRLDEPPYDGSATALSSWSP